MSTPTEIAWAAGFMDAEGCLSIRKYKVPRGIHYSHQLDIHLSNTCEEALIKFQEIVGVGNIYLMKRRGAPAHWKPSWQYQCNAHKAEGVVHLLLPYLVVKRKEAEVALEFIAIQYDSYGRDGVADDVYAERERLYLKMQSVKHRFRPVPKPVRLI